MPAFGQPSYALATHQGLPSTALPMALHAHYNWGFTRPGTYTAVFEATGGLTAGGSTRALAVYTFLISDKPVLLEPLEGDVKEDGVVDELDLGLVESNLGRTARVWPAPDVE